MNTLTFDGYLPRDAEECYVPATATATAYPKLTFGVGLRDSRGVEFYVNCAIDDPALMREYRERLVAGCWARIEGEQSVVQQFKHGVLHGLKPVVRVLRMEFPARGGAKRAEVGSGMPEGGADA